ncbi:hypothetical protein GCM10027018_31070 [Paenibacillus thermoaerophilus]
MRREAADSYVCGLFSFVGIYEDIGKLLIMTVSRSAGYTRHIGQVDGNAR